jgi:hypothetical protein
MDIEKCLSCGTRMIPMANGICPSCQKPWNVEPVKKEKDPSIQEKTQDPALIKFVRFINGKSILIALLGIVIFISGAMGFSFNRRGHAVGASDAVPMGIGLLVFGLVLYVPTRIIVKKHDDRLKSGSSAANS